jgi:hypothetical protein
MCVLHTARVWVTTDAWEVPLPVSKRWNAWKIICLVRSLLRDVVTAVATHTDSDATATAGHEAADEFFRLMSLRYAPVYGTPAETYLLAHVTDTGDPDVQVYVSEQTALESSSLVVFDETGRARKGAASASGSGSASGKRVGTAGVTAEARQRISTPTDDHFDQAGGSPLRARAEVTEAIAALCKTHSRKHFESSRTYAAARDEIVGIFTGGEAAASHAAARDVQLKWWAEDIIGNTVGDVNAFAFITHCLAPPDA